MLNNGNKNNCGFSDDMVAYIYDEIGQAERGKFESHLSGCTACTDDFAGISNARFSVFEWQKEEFAHLSTPQIVIPYASKHGATETAGLWAGLRKLLSSSGWPSVALAAGALAVCVGLGFVAINYVGSGQQTADNNKIVNEKAVPPVAVQNPENTLAMSNDPLPKEQNLTHTTTASAKSTPGREIRPVRASVKPQRIQYDKNLTASTQAGPAQQKRKAPALTVYDDEDDRSLRLADLFDEGGS